MANNRNQHFVPRCYLKPFTKDGAGLAINLYNLKLSRVIPDAPVKNQSSGNYFYGKDQKLEDAIQSVEGPFAQVVTDICSNTSPVTRNQKAVLRRFIYLQYLRTEARSSAIAYTTFALIDIPGVNVERPSLKEAMREAVQEAMYLYVTNIRMLDDLKVCLIRNRTAVPFFTSDDPAIMANRWHQKDARTRGRSFGLGNPGLIFLLPLSPSVLCILYDGDVYSVPNHGGWIAARKVTDIRLLNEHQILNCTYNLYFQNWENREDIAIHVAKAKIGRTSVPIDVVTAMYDKTTDRGERYSVVPKSELQPDRNQLVHVLTPPRDHPDGQNLFLSGTGGKFTATTLSLHSRGDGYSKKASKPGLAITNSVHENDKRNFIR